MKETRNWVEMPDEIMGGLILQRLGALEILTSAERVCRTWRRICKDPAMWKMIDLDFSSSVCYFWKIDLEKLIKQAVDRSCGELIDISLHLFTTDDLLDYISRCSSKLNRLRLTDCHGVTGHGLSNALKRLPHLETLKLSYIYVLPEHIEVIGRNCPQLKSFEMKTVFVDGDAHAQAIANSMPALRHLKLVNNTTCGGGDNGIQAILNGCPHLQSLHMHGLYCLDLDENLEKLCRERIKDFKYTNNNLREGDEDFEMDFTV